METLNLYTRLEPKETTRIKTRDVQFENGTHQYQQVWTEPEVIIEVTTSGLADYMEYLQDFFNRHGGMAKPFLCDVYKDGNPMLYRFGKQELDIKWAYSIPEKRKVFGSTEITLLRLKGQNK